MAHSKKTMPGKKGKAPNCGKDTRIKKGEVRNPLGGGAHNPEIKKLRNLTRAQVVEVGSLVLEKNMPELKRIWHSKTESSLKCWFAGVAYMAVTTGNSTHYNALLDRVIGKVKDEIKLEADVKVREKYKRMTDEELAAEMSERALRLSRIAKA